MAHKLQAVNKYRPQITLRPSIGMPELVELIGSRTGLNKGEIQMVLSELSEAVQFYCRQGQGVKLEGLGTYLPGIKINGSFYVSHRLDVLIKNSLNAPGAFKGEIKNRSNIGKTTDELVSQWNEENPDNTVENS